MGALVAWKAPQERAHAPTARAEVHAMVDRILDAVDTDLAALEDERPRLRDLTTCLGAHRGALMGAMVEAYVQQHYADLLTQDVAPCPGCGRCVHREKALRGRTVETLMGSSRLQRPYFYCRRCRVGYAPLDAALGLAPERKQSDVQEEATRLALEMPYGDAEAFLARLTDARLSDCAIHEVVGQFGGSLDVLDVAPSREAIQERIETLQAGRSWRPIAVLALDGSMIPTRPDTARGTRPGRRRQRAHRARWKGEYREAKGFRLFLVDEERIVHLVSWHQVANEEEVGRALKRLKEAGRIPEDQVRLCVIGDGASWIWKWVKELFPSARQVLDFYHLSQYVHDVAQTQYGADPSRACEWLEATLARLNHNEAAGVLWGLQRMQPISEEAAKAIAAAVSYLSEHLSRVEYGSHRKGGYPIGSGAIESAHRFIAHVRLKRSGAWWYEASSNHMLALRCAKYNGTLEAVFERHAQTRLTQ